MEVIIFTAAIILAFGAFSVALALYLGLIAIANSILIASEHSSRTGEK